MCDAGLKWVKGYSVNYKHGTRHEVSCLMIHYDSLLQSATEVYYKIRQVFDCKMRQFYYKM